MKAHETKGPTAVCGDCGKEHPLTDLEIGFALPDEVVAMKPAERRLRARSDGDRCLIDGRRLFVRGVLPLPVHGRDSPYSIGFWAEIEDGDREAVEAQWSRPAALVDNPFRGRLANALPTVASTNGVAVDVFLEGSRRRPTLRVADASHELYRQQNSGITFHRLDAYNRLVYGSFN